MFAWLLGEGILVWRWAKNGAPPTPGALALASGLFAGLAVIAEYEPARGVATLFAFAVDAAVLMQVLGKDPGKMNTGWPPGLMADDVIFPGGRTPAKPKSGTSTPSATA